jgi:hypothetical protein
MRFSEIVGHGFFGIKLSSQQFDLLDKHFLAASHHRYRWIEDEDHREIHLQKYYEHLQCLMGIVRQGDFSRFFQHPALVKAGFNRPERWMVPVQKPSSPMDGDRFLFDPTLFSEMCADVRWGSGVEHPYDVLLDFDLQKGSNISLFAGMA